MTEMLSIGPGLPPGIFVPLPDAPRRPLPLNGVKVSAGFPSPAADYEDARLDINEYLVRDPVSTFFFAVQGDSIQGAEIFDGDILVVDRSVRARHGHIVIAFVNGERLVKRLHRRSGRVVGGPRFGRAIHLTPIFLLIAPHSNGCSVLASAVFCGH
jgi:DNA polymerase V